MSGREALKESSQGNCDLETMSLSSTCPASLIQFIPHSQHNVIVCHTLKGKKKPQLYFKAQRLHSDLKEMIKQFSMKMSQTCFFFFVKKT